MKRLTMLLCGFMLAVQLAPALPASAAAKNLDVSGAVTAVTLYRGQALITRELNVEGEKGLLEIVVPNLPPQIVPDSLFAEGSEALEIRAVRYRTRAVKEEVDETFRKLKAEWEATNKEQSLGQMKLEMLNQRVAYLSKLEAFVAPTAQVELSQGVLDAEALEKITKFNFESRTAILEEQFALQQQAETIAENLALLERKMSEISANNTKTLREAVLFVQKTADPPQQIKLSYLVQDCGWSPTYTSRVTGERDTVQLEYNALIYQRSGEAWEDVVLTLSTASPALSAAVPGLAPFDVILSSQPPTQTAAPAPQQTGQYFQSQLRDIQTKKDQALTDNQKAYGLGKQLDTNWKINSLANEQQSLELTAGAALVEATGNTVSDEPSMNYTIGGGVSLASRDDQQMVRVVQADMPSDFYFVGSPVLTNFVYREAALTNDSAVDLLAGPISVYLDGKYVGRSEIPTVARGQTFVVGFGADPQLRVKREIVNKEETTQGGNRVCNVEIRLVVENYKTEDETIRIYDRLPNAARESDIRVTLKEPSISLSEDKLYLREERPEGILRWDLPVAKQSIGESAATIEYTYTIEYDRNYQLATPSTIQLQEEFEKMQLNRLKR